MSNFYNSTTLKKIELLGNSILNFDLANQKKTNLCLATSLYISAYKFPIFVSLVTLINNDTVTEFGKGSNLNVTYKLNKTSSTQLKLIHPTLDEETFVYKESTTDSTYDSITYKYYNSTTSKRYIIEEVDGTTSKHHTIYDDNFELYFNGATVGLTLPLLKYKAKGDNGNYWLNMVYNESYQLYRIYNNIPEKEYVQFTYTNGLCSKIQAYKNFTGSGTLTGTLISTIDITYSNSIVNTITEKIDSSTAVQISRIITLSSNKLTISDDISDNVATINLSTESNKYYLESASIGVNNMSVSYENDYKTTIQMDLDVQEYYFNSNNELLYVKTNDTIVQAYNYKLDEMHQLESESKELYVKTELNGTPKYYNSITQFTENTVTDVASSDCPAASSNVKKVRINYFDSEEDDPDIIFSFNESGTKLDVVTALIWYKVISAPTSATMYARMGIVTESNTYAVPTIFNDVYFNLKSNEWNFMVVTLQAGQDFGKVSLTISPDDYFIEMDMHITLFKDSFATLFRYDSNGNISKKLTGKTLNHMSFNKSNNLILSKINVYSYDENGNAYAQISPKKFFKASDIDDYENVTASVVQSLDGKGMYASASYENNERLIRETDTKGKSQNYLYSGPNKRLSQVTYSDRVTTNSYNTDSNSKYGLLKETSISENSSLAGKLEYEYFDSQKLKTAKSSFDGINKFEVGYTYDDTQRIKSITHGGNKIYNCEYSTQDGQLASYHYGNNAKKTEFEYETSDKATLHNIKQIKYAGNTKYHFNYATDGSGLLNSIVNCDSLNVDNEEISYNYGYEKGLLKSTSVGGRTGTDYTNTLLYNHENEFFAEQNKYSTQNIQTEYVNSSKMTINSINGFEYSLLAEDNANLYWSMMIRRYSKDGENESDISYLLYNKENIILPYHARLGRITETYEYSYLDHGLRLLQSETSKWAYNYKFDEDVTLGNKYGIFFSFIIPSVHSNQDIISIGNDNLIDSYCFMVNSSTNQLNVKLRNTSTILDSLNIDVSNLIDNIHFIAINVTHSGSGTSHSYSFDIYVDGAFKGTVSGVNNLEMDNISFLSRLGDNQFEGQLSSVIINTNEHFTSDKIQDYYKRLKLIYDNNDVYQDDFDMVINGNTSSYDMINFHNNYNSFNGVKPATQLNNPNITDISENFEYVDDVIESGVGNYVYALKNQTLTYNFSQTNSGMIGTKYKPISGKSMTIMELVGTTGLDISIYCYGSSVLYVKINGTQYVVGSQTIDSWNTIIVSWSKVVASSSLESDAFTVKIYLNGVSKINQSISTTSSITNMLVSIGKTTTSTSTTNETMGYIEKLVYDTNNISDTTASTIHTLLNTNYYCKNTYDDFSRKSSKEVLTEGNVKIKNNYSFKLSQSVYETNQLDKEVLNISGYNWETRTYTFDDYGSVTNVSVFTNSDGTTKNKAYTYSKGQLSSESDGTNTFTYNYDGRGNLTSIAQNGTTNKTFTYSNDGLKLTNVNVILLCMKDYFLNIIRIHLVQF